MERNGTASYFVSASGVILNLFPSAEMRRPSAKAVKKFQEQLTVHKTRANFFLKFAGDVTVSQFLCSISR
jgi:hypothetical protein